VEGIADELKPSDPANGDDSPTLNLDNRLQEGIFRVNPILPVRSCDEQRWSALGTSDRLGMKPAIFRRMILRIALAAHQERCHRCLDRSYGTPFAIENRGPQFVQLMKA
jgi:hypothetical protein